MRRGPTLVTQRPLSTDHLRSPATAVAHSSSAPVAGTGVLAARVDVAGAVAAGGVRADARARSHRPARLADVPVHRARSRRAAQPGIPAVRDAHVPGGTDASGLAPIQNQPVLICFCRPDGQTRRQRWFFAAIAVFAAGLGNHTTIVALATAPTDPPREPRSRAGDVYAASRATLAALRWTRLQRREHE